MKNPKFKMTCCALAISASASLGAYAQSTAPAPTTQATSAARQSTDATDIVKNWPDDSRKAVDMMTKKYGPPNEATPTRVIWLNNGPWKETIISKDPIDHKFPMAHKDVMEQVINYKVPPDKFDELAAYDGSVIVERTKGTMSARCDKEEANFLALNLAHDIVTGKKNVVQARTYYARAMKEMMGGKMDPYLQKLQFAPQSNTADPDQPAKMAADEMAKSGSMSGGAGNPPATGRGRK